MKEQKTGSQISGLYVGAKEIILRLQKQKAAKVMFRIILLFILPVALTLRTVKQPVTIKTLSDNPTPLGYTWSLSLFIFPMIGIAWWFLREPKYNIQKKTFYISLLILVPLGFLLDLIFGNFFFTFPNEYATTGIEVPAVGGGLPIEEFIFYISGFIFVLLAYLWSSEYWFKAYSLPDHLIKAKQVDKILRFDPRSVVLGAILLLVAFIYKKFFSSSPEGFPGYFTYLVVASIIPCSALLSSTKSFINWRAFSFTFFVITLISLLWEVTLAIPYGWWNYKSNQMMGLFINAWWKLPVEAVCVWFMVTFTTVILYETIKIWQNSGKKIKDAFLGCMVVSHEITMEMQNLAKNRTKESQRDGKEGIARVESKRMKLVILTLIMNIVGNLIAYWLNLGWVAAVFITFSVILVILFYTTRENDKLFGRLIFFGLIVGFGELLSDFWAVDVQKTLVYAPGEPFIWKSPFYMPFGWTIIMVQLGYIATWMIDRWGMLKTIIMISILGGINIPIYEYLAKGAGFWHYQNATMILNDTTPIYVIGGEVLLAIALPIIALKVKKGPLWQIIPLGIAQALWIWISTIISYRLLK